MAKKFIATDTRIFIFKSLADLADYADFFSRPNKNRRFLTT